MNISRSNFCLFFLLFFASKNVTGQGSDKHKILLKSGEISLTKNIEQSTLLLGKSARSNAQKMLVILQFIDIPSDSQKKTLKEAGVELLEYIPENSYSAVANSSIDASVLTQSGVVAIFQPQAEHKMGTDLMNGNIPTRAKSVAGKIDLRINFLKSSNLDAFITELQQLGCEILSKDLVAYEMLDIRIPQGQVQQIANLSWIQFVDFIPATAVSLNDKSEAATKANILGSSASFGYNLKGKGITVGIGDNASPMRHIDLASRVVSFTTLGDTYHGVHVAGTIAGSGLLNEKATGYAPQSSIISRETTDVLSNSAAFARDYGMVITNNSYSIIDPNRCQDFGVYEIGSGIPVDRQAFELPFLQHVFASGNSGNVANCQGLPVGYANIMGGYQSTKNVITVGQTQVNGAIAPASSKGPLKDGRMKPEITAPGTSILSTFPNNAYSSISGTSMAAPAVSGGLALLYERYRQLNNQNNPKNALMKAIIMNGASDQGIAGPDYSFGFGQMNLLRSITILNKGNFQSGSVGHQANNTHQISVPANTAKLKVMLYWNDPAPSVLSGGKALVNNLDLKVTKPGNQEVLPFVLNPTDPTAPAVPGIDSLNNAEQIVIEAPKEGSYSIEVKGSKVPQGPQEYFVVYDIIENATAVTYPTTGDRLANGDVVNINWESYGDNTNTFSVSYSVDNGSTWTTINSNVAANVRLLSWTVPALPTGSAKIKVTQNKTSTVAESGAFTILGVPAVSLSSIQCDGYFATQWNAVNGATDYEVLISSGGEMRTVGYTSELKYVINSLSRDSTYFVSVRARINQVPGRRSVAVSRMPNFGTCEGTISDNDLKIESIVSPAPAVRAFTGNAYTSSQKITIRIKNLDDQVYAKPFRVGYILGDNMVNWETVNQTIPQTGTLDYTFAKPVDLSAEGEHRLTVIVKGEGDPVTANDNLQATLRHIPNAKLSLPYFQQVEDVPTQEIKSNTIGIQGAEAFDFIRISGNSRVRTADKPVRAFDSQKAFILDGSCDITGTNSSYFEGTFNLSNYQAASHKIMLSFRHTLSIARSVNSSCNVYIRGGNAGAWAKIYTVTSTQTADTQNGYQLANIDLSQALINNQQDFSVDTQIRWEVVTTRTIPYDGYVVDDIKIYTTQSDVRLVSLVTPNVTPCDLGTNVAAVAVFKNNGGEDYTNYTVKLSTDGAITNYTIPSIKKDSSVTLTMTYPAQVYQAGDHKLIFWADAKKETQSMPITINTTQAVAVYPYFQNFEGGSAGWYAEGKNSSWQLGTPNSNGVKFAGSGSNAWKTNLNGNYNNFEESYLYSPCLNIAGNSKTKLSFSAYMNMEACSNGDCYNFYVEYNKGNGWVRLGTTDAGINWYNAQNDSKGIWQGQNEGTWKVFTASLPETGRIKLRFVFKSNNGANSEGVAIDDIHIYDQTYDIYAGQTVSTGITPTGYLQNIGATFNIGGKIVTAVEGFGQNLDNMKTKTFLNEGSVRTNHNAFVLDRSFVIESAQTFATPVRVRLYVSESEIDKFASSIDHTGLTKPQIIQNLMISKYSGSNQDGDINNNLNSGWSYFTADKVQKIPYGNGYYFEFETTSFSEFWLTTGPIQGASSLPVKLKSFTAEKSESIEGNSVNLKWATTTEEAFDYFELQVALGADQVKSGSFETLAQIAGAGGENLDQNYKYTDRILGTSPIRYYRIKMVDLDGTFSYSSIRSVEFNTLEEAYVYPNPSTGIFKLNTPEKSSMQIHVYDLQGKLRKKLDIQSTSADKQVDLSSSEFNRGSYLIKVISPNGKKAFKVVKE